MLLFFFCSAQALILFLSVDVLSRSSSSLSWICTIVYWGESRWERPEKLYTGKEKKRFNKTGSRD